MTLGCDRYMMNLDTSIKCVLKKKRKPQQFVWQQQQHQREPAGCWLSTVRRLNIITSGLIRAAAGQPLFSASVLANQEQLAAAGADGLTACGGSMFPLRPRGWLDLRGPAPHFVSTERTFFAPNVTKHRQGEQGPESGKLLVSMSLSLSWRGVLPDECVCVCVCGDCVRLWGRRESGRSPRLTTSGSSAVFCGPAGLRVLEQPFPCVCPPLPGAS